MPQRLSDLGPGVGGLIINNAGDLPLLRKPRLAALAMSAVASWSDVEGFRLRLFIQLLGGKGAVAADVYLALQGNAPKDAAIVAAAESVLTGDMLEVLRAIMAIAKTNEKARDKLAHGIWGECTKLPDALVVVDPRNLIEGEFDYSHFYVYKESDFKQIIEANHRLCGFGMSFTGLLKGVQPGTADEAIQQLAREPEIAERLGHLKARQDRATSAKPPQTPPPGTYT